MALNRKAIDIARHNINTGFGFAVSLAGAKNLAEVMELQAAYWHKHSVNWRPKLEKCAHYLLR